jgi:hypothetical protein
LDRKTKLLRVVRVGDFVYDEVAVRPGAFGNFECLGKGPLLGVGFGG